MRKALKKLWVSNNGWILSAAGVVVAALASFLWYLDWIPDLAWPASPRNPIMSEVVQAQNGILICQITGAERFRGMKGKIQIYIPQSDSTRPPAFQETFTVDQRGRCVNLMIIPAREYFIVAFLDANDNGAMDVENDKPVEEFRMPRIITFGSMASRGSSASPGNIRLFAQAPVMCEFDFSPE